MKAQLDMNDESEKGHTDTHTHTFAVTICIDINQKASLQELTHTDLCLQVLIINQNGCFPDK